MMPRTALFSASRFSASTPSKLKKKSVELLYTNSDRANFVHSAMCSYSYVSPIKRHTRRKFLNGRDANTFNSDRQAPSIPYL